MTHVTESKGINTKQPRFTYEYSRLTASHYPRFRPFPNETCDRSVRVYSHGFVFVLAVNRIACAGRACAGRARAGRAPVSSRAPRRMAMPTTWERTHHANPDARQHPHHTPTLRSLEPYYYYIYTYLGWSHLLKSRIHLIQIGHRA